MFLARRDAVSLRCWGDLSEALCCPRLLGYMYLPSHVGLAFLKALCARRGTCVISIDDTRVHTLPSRTTWLVVLRRTNVMCPLCVCVCVCVCVVPGCGDLIRGSQQQFACSTAMLWLSLQVRIRRGGEDSIRSESGDFSQTGAACLTNGTSISLNTLPATFHRKILKGASPGSACLRRRNHGETMADVVPSRSVAISCTAL